MEKDLFGDIEFLAHDNACSVSIQWQNFKFTNRRARPVNFFNTLFADRSGSKRVKNRSEFAYSRLDTRTQTMKMSSDDNKLSSLNAINKSMKKRRKMTSDGRELSLLGKDQTYEISDSEISDM